MSVLPLLLLCASIPPPDHPAPFELVLSAPAGSSLVREDLRSPSLVWPELFDGAQRSIDLAEFYIADQPGAALRPMIEHLARAGARGVKIRFLVEKKMEASSRPTFAELRAIKNLELRVIDFSKVQKDGILHAKYFVVDRQKSYLGSQNFDWRSLVHIHELGVRIADPEISRELAAIFEQDWQAAELVAEGKPVPPLRADRPAAPADRDAYLVASPYAFDPPGVGDSESELVRLIGTAKDSIEVELLDYCPLTYAKHELYPTIDVALRAASARGVKVRMLVSDWNAEKPCIQHVQSLAAIPNVSVRMVTIPEASEGFIPYSRVIHAKYMVLDERLLWVGTSNWAGGYLDRSRNVELVLKDPGLVKQADSIHHQLWDSAYAQPLEPGRSYPVARRR